MFTLYPFGYGQGRVIDRTLLGRHRTGLTRSTARTTDGFDLDIMPDDHIGRHLRFTGQFDRTIPDVLVSLSRDGDHILDVGANIGYVACMMLRHIANARLAAVEPRPDCFALLAGNLKRLSSGAIAVNAAVSDHDGTGLLEMAAANSGASRLIGASADENELRSQRLSVELLTGKSLLTRIGFPRIDLVKIDVEGHEHAVLRTLLSSFGNSKPRAIVFEHHARFAGSERALYDLLISSGYELLGIRKALRAWRLVPVVSADTGPFFCDYVARLR